MKDLLENNTLDSSRLPLDSDQSFYSALMSFNFLDRSNEFTVDFESEFIENDKYKITNFEAKLTEV